jgi:photosystem II stability/assembly factor-like uncharacterized protein
MSVAASVSLLVAWLAFSSPSFANADLTAHTELAGFAPEWAVQVGSTSEVIVVGTTSCAKPPCIELLRTADGGRGFVRLSSPPVVSEEGALTGSLEGLIFANPEDGYALENVGAPWPSILYATFDGGRSWHREVVVPGFSVYGNAATPTRFYFVMARCIETATANSCKYELATSPAGTGRWSEFPFPLSSKLGGEEVGVAAYGSNVWLSEEALFAFVAVSHDDGRSFVSHRQDYMSGGGCWLSAMSATALWAECSGGMSEGFLHSSDGGEHFESIRAAPGFSGTGGGAFEPVSASVAYIDPGAYAIHHPYELYRMTAAGSRIEPVGSIRLDGITSLIFTSDADGIAVGYRQAETRSLFFMLRTSDGGRDWTAISL